MPDDRWTLLGLARPTVPWFRELVRATAAGEVPGELARCISADDLHVRLRSGRPWSAAVLDAGFPGVDRDLLDDLRRHGTVAVVVDEPAAPRRDWLGLGAAAVLPPTTACAELPGVLRTRARPVRHVDTVPAPSLGAVVEGGWRGRLVAVTGAAGSGRSTVAAALAQGLGAGVGATGSVLLADLCLHADQALLHDAVDLTPGLPELVDAHRAATLTVEQIRSLVFDVADRGYHLLLGVRRHREWTALRPRAVEAALDGVLRAYGTVVADLDGDVEGAEETGSVDVEERNVLARSAVRRADVVALVASPGLHGLHGFGRTLADLLGLGIEPRRVVPVVNRSPRRPRERAELARAVADLGAAVSGGAAPGPSVFLPWRARVDTAHHVGGPLPSPLPERLAGAVRGALHRLPAPSVRPGAVAPGSLGVAGGRP